MAEVLMTCLSNRGLVFYSSLLLIFLMKVLFSSFYGNSAIRSVAAGEG